MNDENKQYLQLLNKQQYLQLSLLARVYQLNKKMKMQEVSIDIYEIQKQTNDRIRQRINIQIQKKFQQQFILLSNILCEQLGGFAKKKIALQFEHEKYQKLINEMKLNQSASQQQQQLKSQMLFDSFYDTKVQIQSKQEQQNKYINYEQISLYEMHQIQQQSQQNTSQDQSASFQQFQLQQNEEQQQQKQSLEVDADNSMVLDITNQKYQHSQIDINVQNQNQLKQNQNQNKNNKQSQKKISYNHPIKNKYNFKKNKVPYKCRLTSKQNNQQKKSEKIEKKQRTAKMQQQRNNTISTNIKQSQIVQKIDPNVVVIDNFRKLLEQGDYVLNQQKIKQAYLMYGMKEVGKTVAANLLVGRNLKIKKQNGQAKIQVIQTRKSRFTIESNKYKKYTLPQIFKIENYQFEGGRKHIIELPGFNHNNDQVLNILFNGYFRYRLYSKIPCMKFILCFQPNQFQNNATGIIFTISNFIKNFNNFSESKHQIFKSSGFLFNKVDQVKQKPNSYQIIREKLQKLAQNLNIQQKNEQTKNIKEFITYMYKNNKIFIIHKVIPKQLINNPKLIGHIDVKIQQWWRRQINSQMNLDIMMEQKEDQENKQSMNKITRKQEIYDMKKVALYLGNEIAIQTALNKPSQQKYKYFVSTYNKKLTNFICGDQKQDRYSLRKILDEIVIDAMGSLQSHISLDAMKVPVKKYYSELKNKAYAFSRQIEQNRISDIKGYLSPINPADMKINYFIKKHKVLKKIQSFLDLLKTTQLTGNQMYQIYECTQIILSIIKYFQILQYYENDKKRIISRYCYLFKRLIQEAKIFMLLLTDFQHLKENQLLEDKHDENNINLFIPIKKLMSYTFTYRQKQTTAQQLHQIYIKNFHLEKLKKSQIDINDQFLQFFMQIKQIDKTTKQLIVNFILKYSNKMLNKNLIIQNEICKLAEKLIIGINYSYDLKLNTSKDQKKQNILLILRKLTIYLGQALQSQKKYKYSRKVFDSINFKNNVCRLYQKQILEIESMSKSSIEIRCEFIDYLKQNKRPQQAAKLMQQTFEKADSLKELREFQRYQHNLSNLLQQDQGYLNEQIFGKLDDNLLEELEIIYKVSQDNKRKRIQLQ